MEMVAADDLPPSAARRAPPPFSGPWGPFPGGGSGRPRLTRTRSIRCMEQGPNLYEVLGRVELPAG